MKDNSASNKLMQAFFSPAVALMDRLDVTRKFVLLGLMSSVAIAVVVYSLFASLDQVISFSQRELKGLELIKPFHHAVQTLQQHRGLSAGLLGGDESMRDRRAGKEREADKALDEIWGKPFPGMTSGEDLQHIKIDWERLRKEGLNWTAAENFAAHTRLIDRIQSFEVMVADEYALILDPELSTYYLIDTIINKLPCALEHLGQLRAHCTGILAKKQVTAQQKIEINILVAELDDAIKSLNTNLDKTGRYNPALQGLISAASRGITGSAQQITGLAASDILTGHFATLPNDFFVMSTAVIDKSYTQLYETLLPTAETLIKARIARAENTLRASIGIACLLFLIVAYFSIGTSRAVIANIRSLARSAHAFADGDLSKRIDLGARDEFGQVGDSFNEMADGFSALLKVSRENEACLHDLSVHLEERVKERTVELEFAQRLTESLLRRNQALMMTSMDGIHVLDMQGNLVEANDAFCRMLGYSREEVAGFNVADWTADFSGGESRVRFGNHIEQSVMIEALYHRKDGALINVETSIAREEIDGQGLLFCSSRNITGRKKAYQEILLKSEAEHKHAEILTQQSEMLTQQFGSLLQGSFNEIYMFDAHSMHFILTSEGAEKNLGYSSDELNQLTPLDLNSSLTRESCERLIAPLRSGEQLSLFFEIFLQRKNGTTYPVEVRLQFMDGDPPVFLAIVQDITERKQAERWLYESMKKIEDLYNYAPCGYHSLGKDGLILMINDTELEWLGYVRDEVVEKMKLPDLLTPASLRVFHETFPQLKKLGFARDIELELIRKDGTILVGLISATAIYDPSGDYVMSRSTVTDITGRKKAEQKLHDLTAHLQAVREEEKTSIAREIHDDLGGTLTAMNIETYLLKNELSANRKTAPLLGHVEKIAQLVDSAMGVMRNIITGIRPTMLDDLGLLAALEWQAAQFHQNTGIECRVNCVCARDEDCEKELDKPRSIALFRIAQEALTNVKRHSGASRVVIEFHRNDEEIVLSIIDNGRGMAESRTDTSIPYGILGMKERADQLGGKINLDTQPGGGFNVTVILPLPASEKEET